jgi:dTDP-4-dehydrorhamnose 3,5-epimerase
MIFSETKLAGAYVIEPEQLEDERGFFARLWSEQDFAERGLVPHFIESNTSFSRKRGTLRGMHYQAAPHGQVKLVRCTAGAVYDAIIDLRPDSPTYKQWDSVELSADNHLMLYVPIGFAHGFQTLVDGTEVTYQMSSPYHPASSRGVRWDDPTFGITWPKAERVIIARDREYSDFAE